MTAARYAGKRVMITGSGGYFGRELAAAFADAGAMLTLLDRPASESGAPAAPAWHTTTRSLEFDLSRADAIDALIDGLPDNELPDILVNNAAIYPFADILEVDIALCRQMLEVNLLAPLALSQALARRWIAGGRTGTVVNVSSAAAEVARPNGALYGPTKAALEQLTRILAVRLGGQGIRVNAVRPGIADDPERPHIPASHLAAVAGTVPMGRTIAPGELARAVLFLAGEEASFTTGQVLSVDGGGGLNRRVQLTGTST